tara:strand:- start:147 stop:605 length:459 start_codon:yes stop_codon:yes gene_type:complete
MSLGLDFNLHLNSIRTNFIIDECGIELDRVGSLVQRLVYPVNLQSDDLMDIQLLSEDFYPIANFLKEQLKDYGAKLVWLKINVIDQAINDYVGIGTLDENSNFLKFITTYLSVDQADQNGDTIIIFFNQNLSWAINFTLCQDDSTLIIERYG